MNPMNRGVVVLKNGNPPGDFSMSRHDAARVSARSGVEWIVR
jgi:hypothetical protein